MTSTKDVQQLGGPAAPRVVRVPSLRRLLRPGPTLVLLALLVGAASAPTGPGAQAADAHGRSAPSRDAASAPQVPGWQQEADPRTAVAAGSGTGLPVAPSPVVLPLSPVVLVEPPGSPGSAVGVGADLWAAYRSAAAAVPASCHLDPRLLAAIGQVESGSLAGRSLDSRHRAVPPVLGPVLDGNGYARIPDTDHGRWDGDPVWDRAVGPMQFIPSTWARWGVDADGDGVADPQDIEDASLSAAYYLCAGGRDLSAPADLRAAILSYNHSATYLATVLALVPRMTPGALGTTVVGSAPSVQAALFVGPPSVQPTTAAPASASPGTSPADTPSPTTSTAPAAGTPTAAATPRTATRTWTGSPTTSATSTASGSSTTSGSPTTTSGSPTTTGTTTSTTTSTTSAPSTTTSPTGTSSPSSSTTTAACPSGSTTSTATSGTTSPSSPSGTASPTPTASCTTTAAPTRTPVPSTSSATAAEATLLGQAGPSAAG